LMPAGPARPIISRVMKPRSLSLDKDHSFHWNYALLVILVALVFRMAFLGEAASRPDFRIFYMDEEYNLGWAKSIATGVWKAPYDQLRHAPYFRAPLYSLFLAGLFKIFGYNVLLARIVQVLIGSLSCALAYGVAARLLGQRVGLATGLICALYWVLAYFDSQFLQPVLLVFLLLLGLLAASVAAERQDTRLSGLGGLAFGLYSITRPEILAWFPFAVWWGFRASRRRWFAIALAIGFVLPPAATTVRNRIVGHDWVPVASQGGVNFYIGNNAQSNGMQAVVPGTHETWWGGFEDTKAIAEKAAGRSLKPSEISDYWYGQGLKFIRDDPAAWVRLTLRKAFLFIGNVEIPNNEPYEFDRKSYIVLRVIPLGFGVLLALFVVALPGLLLHRSNDLALILQFAGIYALTTIAFFVTGRYRVPLVPVIAIGAGATLVRIYDDVRARQLMKVGVVAVVVAAIAGALSVDYFGVRKETRGFAEYTQALNMLDAGDANGAIAKLDAVRASGSVKAPEVYVSLVRAHIARGMAEDAKAVLQVSEEGLRLYPNEPELLWYAATGSFSNRQWDIARGYIDRYLALKPRELRAIYLAFSVALVQGRTDDARTYLAQAEAIDSASPVTQEMRNALQEAQPQDQLKAGSK